MIEARILKPTENLIETVAIIDNFESLIWTDRIGEAGDFELYMYRTSQIFDIAKPGYFVTIPQSSFVMVIESVRLTTDFEDGDRVIISGRSLESILDRRVVWDKTHLNGDLQNGVYRLLKDAIIDPADSKRRIPNFVFEESTEESVTKVKTRAEFYGDDLYSIMAEIFTVYNIGYRILLTDDNQYVFKLYSGIDRSYSQDTIPWVAYSVKFGNLISSEFTQSTDMVKNVAMIIGDAKQDKDKDGNYYGLIRRLSTVLGETEGFERKELYVDASSLSREDVSDEVYKQYLEAQGYQELFGYSSTSEFGRQVDTDHSYKYGTDYTLGDLVQFENQYGIGVRVMVTEYTFNEDASGYKEYPTFSQDYQVPADPVINPNLTGSNLLNWSFVSQSQLGTVFVIENEDRWHNKLTINRPSSGWPVFYRAFTNLDTSKVYTISLEYRNITGWEPNSTGSDGGLFGILLTATSPSAAATANVESQYIFQKETGYSEQISLSFTPSARTMYAVFNAGYLKASSHAEFYIDHIKLEEGETPTIWVGMGSN